MLAELGLASALIAGTIGAATLDPPAAQLKPVEGQTITLHFVDDGEPAAAVTVEAQYRQNAHASLQHSQKIGTTSSDGTLRWTPSEPGVVALAWQGGGATIAVRHDGTPISGLLIALLAGILLLGGSVYFFVRMIATDELPPETTRFDT